MKPVRKILVSALIFIIVAIIFMTLRSATQLLGDGYLREDELSWGIGNLPFATKPLDTLLHFGFFKFLNMFNHHDSYKIFSSIAGGAFVLILLNKLKPKQSKFCSPLLIFLGLSGLQFYFGYVESYSLQYIGIFLILIYAYEYLTQHQSFNKLMIAFTLTFMIHFSTAYLMPAYIICLYYGYRDKYLPKNLKLFSLLSIVFMLGAYIYFKFIYLPDFGRISVDYLLSFTPADYWIFSSSHVLDILNNLLLSGLFMILMIPLFIKFKVWQSISKPIKLFSIAVIFGAFLFMLILDPKLGFARDWDLFASTGLVLVMLTFFWIDRNHEKLSNYKTYIQTAVLIPVILTASFITVNQNRDDSIERFKDILTFYDTRSGLGYEALAGQYRRHSRGENDLDEAITYYNKAYEIDSKTRHLTFIAGMYLTKFTQSTDEYKKMMMINAIEKYARRALNDNDTLALAYDYLMAASIFRDDRYKALQYSDSILKYSKAESKPKLYLNRGKIYMELKNSNSAEKEFRAALALDSNYAKAYGYLGSIYLEKGEKDRAIEYYLKLLRLEPENEMRPQIEAILQKLR